MAPSPSCVSWRALAPDNAPVARSSHGVSVVGDTLYVFGGEHVARTPIDSAMHALDLSAPGAAFVAVRADSAPPPRVGHAQASIGSVVYVFGGRQGVEIDEAPLNDLWAFDTATRAWDKLAARAAGDAPCPRSFHVMTAARDKLYVFGGCGPAGTGRLADLHEYDVKRGAWTTLPTSDAIEGRGGAGFAASADGSKLLVAGGFAGREMNDVHAYDVATKTWATLRAPRERGERGGGALRPRSVWPVLAAPRFGDCVVGFGGEVDPSERGHDGAGGFANDVVAIDARTGDARTLEPAPGSASAAPTARGWTSAAYWARENAIVVFGGLSGSDKEPERLGDVQIGVLE